MTFVCTIITGLSTGGAEAMLFKVLSHSDRSRFHHCVISLTDRGEYAHRIEELGIKVIALGLTKHPTTIVRGVFNLVRLLHRLRPDVVHTWMYHADLIGGAAAKLCGIRAIAWNIRHSNLSPECNRRSTLAIVNTCSKLSRLIPKRIVCCSRRAAEVHKDAGYASERIVVIPNGFDLAKFKPDGQAASLLKRQLGVPPGSRLVGMIGREDPQKNHEGFIEAAAHVRQHRPDVHFVMAGRGIDRNNVRIKRMAEALGIGSCVHLLGQREDIPSLMAAFDVFVSSSLGEGFSNVVGEAMATGVPCVVTDVGDSAYIVGETGRVVPSSRMRELADHVIGLLNLPDAERLALGAAARNRVLTLFDIDRVANQYEQLYSDLARN